jgi:arylformamidase
LIRRARRFLVYRFDKAVDLTNDLDNGMPVYPGDPEVSFEPEKTLEKDGVNVSKISMGSHTGTHMDAPRHFITGAERIDEIPVSKLVGEAIVVDMSSKPIGSGISAQDLKQPLERKVREGDFVLCYTGCSDRWGDPKLNSNFTYLAPDGAAYLVSKKIRAFGIDFLSVERFGEPSAPTHKELLSNGIFIIESLSKELKQFCGKRIFFISLPIKLHTLGDGAPARAIAVPIE